MRSNFKMLGEPARTEEVSYCSRVCSWVPHGGRCTEAKPHGTWPKAMATRMSWVFCALCLVKANEACRRVSLGAVLGLRIYMRRTLMTEELMDVSWCLCFCFVTDHQYGDQYQSKFSIAAKFQCDLASLLNSFCSITITVGSISSPHSCFQGWNTFALVAKPKLFVKLLQQPNRIQRRFRESSKSRFPPWQTAEVQVGLLSGRTVCCNLAPSQLD